VAPPQTWLEKWQNSPRAEQSCFEPVQNRLIPLFGVTLMNKISYVLAALATLAITVPSIASAEDKPMMKEGMSKPMMHHHHHHHMKKMMMKKEGM
jgi:hypothetical protein